MPRKPRATAAGVEAGIIQRGNIRQSIRVYQCKVKWLSPLFFICCGCKRNCG